MHKVLLTSALAAATCVTTPAMAGMFSKGPLVGEVEVAATRVNDERMSRKEDHSNQGHERKEGDMMPGYNAPARFDVVSRKWDWYANVSFIYWDVIQEGMTLAVTQPGNGPFLPASASDASNDNLRRMEQGYEYHPGFKLGLGTYLWGHDNWAINAEWTRLSFDDGSRRKPKDLTTFTHLEWLNVGNQNIDGPTVCNDIDADWHFRVNIFDFDLSRAYYSGTKLVLNPFYGIRTVFLDQIYNVNYDILFSGVPHKVRSRNNSDMWSIGPHGGMNMSFLLGNGFRFIGNAGVSILFADFTAYQKQSNDNDAVPMRTILSGKDHVQRLRAMTEMGLGFGWGRYMNRSKQHIDIAATYDFNYWPNQNMMRAFMDDLSNFSANDYGDLYLHGLTLTLTVDF